MPARPHSWTARASLTVRLVLGADIFPITGTRSATSSTTVSMTRSFCSSSRAANSPVVPAAQMPCTPPSIM